MNNNYAVGSGSLQSAYTILTVVKLLALAISEMGELSRRFIIFVLVTGQR